jgi:hypothetical protein
MIAKSYSSLTALITWCCLAPVAYEAHCANSVGVSSTQSEIGAINPTRLAKVVPGISKAKVKSLLGTPWRTVQYNDEETLENEIWEYRGRDSGGNYKIHIEFDHRDVVLIVQKIPDAA